MSRKPTRRRKIDPTESDWAVLVAAQMGGVKVARNQANWERDRKIVYTLGDVDVTLAIRRLEHLGWMNTSWNGGDYKLHFHLEDE